MDDRFKVSDTVFVSRAPPGEDDLRRLAAEGFSSIIDLRQAGEDDLALLPPLEAAAAGRNGLRYAHIPVPTDRIASEMLDRFASALASMPGPVLVHCASGKRSGTFAIAVAAARSGATGRAALARIEAAGAAYGSESMQAVVRRYVDRKSGRAWLQAASLSRAQAPQQPAPTRPAPITPDTINRRIARDIDASIRWHALHPQEIDRRLEELAREWDVERVLTANAATLALGGVLLGAFVDRRWLVLPAAVAALLLQQSVQGWCPPMPLLRRLGVRTAAEIGRERHALKALRGDALRSAGDSSTRAQQVGAVGA